MLMLAQLNKILRGSKGHFLSPSKKILFSIGNVKPLTKLNFLSDFFIQSIKLNFSDIRILLAFKYSGVRGQPMVFLHVWE